MLNFEKRRGIRAESGSLTERAEAPGRMVARWRPGASGRPVAPVRTVAAALFFLLFILITVTPALSQYLRPGVEPIVPDNSSARFVTEERIFAGVAEVERTDREFIEPYPGAPAVLYRTAEQNGHLYQLYLNKHAGRYPVYGAGSYVIKRSLEDGRFVQVKIFLRNDENFFVRISPAGSRSRMSLVLNGKILYTEIPVPLRFEEVLILPFEEVVRSSRHLIDWSLFTQQPSTEEYRSVRRMVELAREALPNLPDAEDGAMDASGGLVFIESLRSMEELPGFNCSGFAKWVCDGIYAAETGTYMEIDPLKEKHLDLRGTGWTQPREDERDPYFGLDWTRNLARTLSAVARGVATETIHPEAADVRQVPLSNYIEDVGYPVDEVRHVLYYLAVEEPGNFYLASVNREFGSEPVLRQHTHVVVLFPYFEESGEFEVAVLERNVETSIESLERRYGKEYVHLVRVAASRRYTPPLFRRTTLPDN